jgi:hypothetical protein
MARELLDGPVDDAPGCRRDVVPTSSTERIHSSMINRSSLKSLSKLFGFGAAGVLLSTSLTASAGSSNFSPVQIEFPGVLMVQDPQGVNYYAQVNSPCTGVSGYSMDTLKIWQSLAQAALLANKNIVLYYTQCTGNPPANTNKYITDIVLKK